MTKYVFLLPREQMAEKVRKIVSEINMPGVDVKAIKTEDTLAEAHSAVGDGGDIIIARGIQASIIKNHTDYTVIDIEVTVQEMGLLITKAKKILDKERPVIAVIGFKNMYCDMEQFDPIFNIKLRTYFVEDSNEIKNAADKAAKDGADLIIGGDAANQRAKELEIPSLFADGLGEEGIKNALNIALSVGRAIELEKNHSAQLRTLLDYSFNGIIKISKKGIVEIFNSIAEDMLDIEPEEAVGKHVTSLIEQFDENILHIVLKDGREYYAPYMEIGRKAYAVSFAPIMMSEQAVDGAIISFSEVQSIVDMEKQIRGEIYFRNKEAYLDFVGLKELSMGISEEIGKAALYAQSSAPVLIKGAAGTEKDLLAKAMHYESPRKNEFFAEVHCDAYYGESLYHYLFDNIHNTGDENRGIVSLLHKGTLVLHKIEYLDFSTQQYLLNLINKKAVIHKSSKRYIPVDFRIIATTEKSLRQEGEEGRFSMELYYRLNTLSLELKPLAGRKEDIVRWTDFFVKKYCKEYTRYISITKDAFQVLRKQSFQGGLTQLESFCQRMVIEAPRRTVNKAFIESLLKEAYSLDFKINRASETAVYEEPEALEIVLLLEKHKGNRKAVAESLGISTTTLWRKMRKLGIGEKYSVK